MKNERGEIAAPKIAPKELGFDPDKLVGLDAREPSHKATGEPEDHINPDRLVEPRQSERLDDNGKLYQVDNTLLPNCEFQVQGYTYHTDSKGRPKSAEGQLHLSESSRRPIRPSIDEVGRGCQKEGDQRGHLIGDRFGGSSGLENLVAMDGNVNQGDYKVIENRCAKALSQGKSAFYKVEPRYKDDSKRPSAFRITYTIDGERTVVTLKNGPKEQK